jgi:hypothetical protein
MPRKHVEGTEVQPDSIHKIILMVGIFGQEHEHIKKGSIFSSVLNLCNIILSCHKEKDPPSVCKFGR